jgi:uncharacterized NAD-dependent epimerase/dehydratase family protein
LRRVYDGFENYPIGPLEREIRILELLAQKPVIALTINHEGMSDDQIGAAIREYEARYGRPATDVLKNGCGKLVEIIREMIT